MPPTRAPTTTMNSTVLLRQITIAIFAPALIMFIIHGVASHQPFPAIGLVPLAASAVLGLFLLYRDRVAGSGSAIQMLSASNILFADTFVSFFMLVCLILTWVNLTKPWWSSGLVVLGTYCSVFLMVSFAIHLYFASAEALYILTSRPNSFQSLAADYVPLVSDYTDGQPEDVEQGATTI